MLACFYDCTVQFVEPVWKPRRRRGSFKVEINTLRLAQESNTTNESQGEKVRRMTHLISKDSDQSVTLLTLPRNSILREMCCSDFFFSLFNSSAMS